MVHTILWMDCGTKTAWLLITNSRARADNNGRRVDQKEGGEMKKKLVFTIVAVAMAVAGALMILPVIEGETTQTQIFQRVGFAGGGG